MSLNSMLLTLFKLLDKLLVTYSISCLCHTSNIKIHHAFHKHDVTQHVKDIVHSILTVSGKSSKPLLTTLLKPSEYAKKQWEKKHDFVPLSTCLLTVNSALELLFKAEEEQVLDLSPICSKNKVQTVTMSVKMMADVLFGLHSEFVNNLKTSSIPEVSNSFGVEKTNLNITNSSKARNINIEEPKNGKLDCIMNSSHCPSNLVFDEVVCNELGILEKDSEKEIRIHEEELLLIRKGENLVKQGNQLIKQGERKIKEGELLLRTHGSNVNSVPCRVPKSSAVNTSFTPKPRKSFIKLTNRMKRKRTDSLREREVEELQHAVKRFKSNSSTDGRAILYGSNLSLQALCNLKLTDRTWTEFKNIVTHNRHLVPPGLTKLKQYKKLTYPEQVEYSETEVKCSLFHMIKHSVSRVFEYLLDYESNCIMSLSQEERDNAQIICKVGGDGQSDQSEFQNSATMKRGVDDRSVYIIVFVLLEIRSGEKIIWKNLIPNNPDATCHLLFCFAKET
nr:uncharacterized protein LOC124809395 [Hydra vulgaris]